MLRVLLVDDEDAAVELTQTVLETDERLDVAGRARDGAEAVALASALDPDVILMDLYMPVMDGIEATRAIRATGSTTPILLVTASDLPGDLERARGAGITGYVAKQRVASDLLPALDKLVLR